MNSKVFVYYSCTENGDYVATIMQQLGYDILKINMIESMPKPFFMKILKYGFLAFRNVCSPIKESKMIPHINDYENIVIGTPIWNKRISTPINTVLKGVERPFDLICYSASGWGEKVEGQLSGKKIKEIINIQNPILNPEATILVLRKKYDPYFDESNINLPHDAKQGENSRENISNAKSEDDGSSFNGSV